MWTLPLAAGAGRLRRIETQAGTGSGTMASLTNGVVIAGGGIAGTALAIGLAQQGVKVVLIEKDADWTPTSSGIFIYANGLRALDHLGALDGIKAAGWVSPDGGNLYLTPEGDTITRTIYPSMGGSHVPPIVGIRRVDLHRVLTARLAQLNVDVRLGVSVSGFSDAPDGPVEITLSDGARLSCDVLIGADGVRSSMRTALFGEIEPHYTGFGVWRSTHAKPKEIDVKIMYMGLGIRLGIMPISDDELYMFGTTREPDKPFYPREQWHCLMREKFADISGGPAVALLEEIATPDRVVYTAVEEVHLPLPWHRGRVCVIGDAAHSSTPFMGQGGAMALEDSVVLAAMLARAFAEGSDITDTLAAFGKRRFDRCKFVQDVSRGVGEAGAIEDHEATLRRDERLRTQGQADVDSFYARMAEAI